MAAAPACYQDVQCALRYLHANAALLNIDPNKIFVIGQSAGGHLSALCATLGDEVLEKTGGWERASSKVAAAIAVAGPFELEPDDGAFDAYTHPYARALLSKGLFLVDSTRNTVLHFFFTKLALAIVASRCGKASC